MKMPAEIEAQAKKVRQVYSDTNCSVSLSDEYKKEFDKLSEMKKLDAAARFRSAHGLSPRAKTPYCS